MSRIYHETYAGFLSYKDKYNKYHVIPLSQYNKDKWPRDKDHYNMKALEERAGYKIETRYVFQSEKDPFAEYKKCSPFSHKGDGSFWFVVNDKTQAEKIYEAKEKEITNDDGTEHVEKDVPFKNCSVDDLMGCPVVIQTKSILYHSKPLKTVGYKLTAEHIKNIEPFPIDKYDETAN